MANTGSSQGNKGTGSAGAAGQGGARDKAEDLAGAAGRKASEAASKAQETASSVGQRAQEMASTVGQRAQEVASNLADRAGGALSSVGQQMNTLAGTLRSSAPEEGTLGTAATAVADRLEAGGQYLSAHSLDQMTDDLAVLVRRYPLQSVLAGVGVGCLVGMVFSRR